MGNAEKFRGKSSDYAKYRERYDAELILPLLRTWCGLTPEWMIADVGAGTGMLGDVFRANGNAVIAVEPNAEMRALCERLHAGDTWFRVTAGTAEETGLPEATVDLVSVGRALHWFRAEDAMREFRRILKPDGWVAIVAAGREEKGSEENQAIEALLQKWSEGRQSTRASYSVYPRLSKFFAGGVLHQVEKAGTMQLEWQELRGLMLSISHTPLPESPKFAGFEAELAETFDRLKRNGKITLVTRCWVNAGRFAA